MSAPRHRRAVDPHVLVADVVGTARISPNVVRVTFSGLEQLTPLGHDQWFRMFLAREGQEHLRLPTRTSSLWYAQYLATPRAKRPWVRAYTVRAARPEVGEIDVDMVVHLDADGNAGPAAAFALTARPGDQVGILDQGLGFDPDHGQDAVLVVADETGMPAALGICGSLPDDARGLVIVEVPTAADRQDVRAPAGVDVRWIVRDELAKTEPGGGPGAVPGVAALAALRAATLPVGTLHASILGESSLATGGRRYLVNEHGVPKAHVDFAGYWRHGHAAT
ncbi:NADPH-dependent ferric siderophore reductase [Sediminihabitans luteus]|uniref:NADPH-dependent ferric siderophore reductase n=1 Tax=Sediminihabitans luteus TaxID=1138585 RepID=A0A2M9CPS3_9CELL|nr:siderophore-interacting protein [Sediminihabitans luteus]PJJ73883.1 NADPH-dependent ferric siderophore reductase [Sediminihabitans luteus]GII98205.1 siderophore-interacting protein [Sediminihabitans luteus]